MPKTSSMAQVLHQTPTYCFPLDGNQKARKKTQRQRTKLPFYNKDPQLPVFLGNKK